MYSIFNDILFWERRMESLEKRRQRYSQKAAWSSEVIKLVEKIDLDIRECEVEIENLFSKVDYLEWVCD
jgi:hypothetical protein